MRGFQWLATVLLLLYNCNSLHLQLNRLLNYNSPLTLRGGRIPAISRTNTRSSQLIKSKIELSGFPSSLNKINGRFHESDIKTSNGGTVFVRYLDSNSSEPAALYLFWVEGRWHITDQVGSKDRKSMTEHTFDLAYMEDSSGESLFSSMSWYCKKGKEFVLHSNVEVKKIGNSASKGSKDVPMVPPKLLPYFIAFMLDSVAVGIALPLLPFYVMERGANALQLSLIVSANYMTQMVGCIAMGKLSDLYGRRIALIACLGASALSFFCVSQSSTLVFIALARMIAGSLGGLVPIMQSAVADSAELADRPKYLGRVMATFGLGFVLGPALSTILPNTMTPSQKIRLASCFPFAGFVIALLLAEETKLESRKLFPTFKLSSWARRVRPKNNNNIGNIFVIKEDVDDVCEGVSGPVEVTAAKPEFIAIPKHASELRIEVILLVVNGFLNMYAFGTETIYAVFLKDTFGHGESMLSLLFAVNGLITGIFQVFLIKPLISAIGMYATLALGNALLALGMIGLAMVRHQGLHFLLFGCHILGYTIADTALVSLISRYSSPSSQGRDLSLNQAAQSAARIFSPLLAGILYERSRRLLVPPLGSAPINNVATGLQLPVGALPFIVGGLCPLLAVGVPLLLQFRRSTMRNEQAIFNSQ